MKEFWTWRETERGNATRKRASREIKEQEARTWLLARSHFMMTRAAKLKFRKIDNVVKTLKSTYLSDTHS
mgnify:FL=1